LRVLQDNAGCDKYIQLFHLGLKAGKTVPRPGRQYARSSGFEVPGQPPVQGTFGNRTGGGLTKSS